MLPSKTGKVLFEALSEAAKRFGIENHVISVTTDNGAPDSSMCDRFKKLAFKNAENGYQDPLTSSPAIFTVTELDAIR